MTDTAAAPAEPYTDDEGLDPEHAHVEHIETPPAAPAPEVGLRPQHHGARTIGGTDMTVIPPATELGALAQMAVTLSAADLVPTALRSKPNDVFAVLLTARDLGVALTTALREFHVIEGKVTLSPKVKLSMVRQQGLGRVWPDEGNDATTATWYGERTDMPGITVSSTWSMADAERIVTKGKKLVDKDNWKHYPARMLSWRALGYLLDDLFGEVATGLYSPDEMGAVTDDDGQVVIDVVGHAEPLPGTKAPRGHKPGPPPEIELLNSSDIEGLQQRIKALPAGGIDELRKLWVGDDPENPRLSPITRMPVREFAKCKALIDSVEARAVKGEWGAWSLPSDDSAAGAPQSEPGAEAAPEPHEGPSGDESSPSEQPEPIEPDTETIDYAIELVQAMEWPQICEQLRERGMPSSGTRNQRRAELAQAMALELWKVKSETTDDSGAADEPASEA